MDFDAVENAIDVGSPIFMYEAIYGASAGDAYRYTGTPLQTIANGKNWLPIQIEHTEIVSNGTLDNQTITITMRSNADLVDMFRLAPPSIVVEINIYRGYLGEQAFNIEWKGRIVSMALNPEEGTAAFSCEPISTSLRNTGLRRKYQLGCPFVLYGSACKVSQLAHTESGAITGIVDARTLQVTLTGAQMGVNASNLIAGVCTVTKANGMKDRRAIVNAVNVGGRVYNVTLMSYIADVSVGLVASLSKGCPHTFSSCRDIFGNVANFGGCPNIPSSNPYRVNTF